MRRTSRPEVVLCFEGSAVLRGRSIAVSRFLLTSSLAACVASSLAAQATTATLQGAVTAIDGAVLPGAEVVAWSRESGSARSALADVRGSYRLLGLAPGGYDVTARAVGFGALRRAGVELILGDEATLNFALEPGAVELDPIVVQAGPSLPVRSEERRVGKECERLCRSRWSPEHEKKKSHHLRRDAAERDMNLALAPATIN